MPKRTRKRHREGEPRFDVYVKNPLPIEWTTKKDLQRIPSPFVFELDPEMLNDHGLLLSMRRGAFERTKNPVMAIEALLIAHEAKLFPPLWVLEWLRDTFKAYHAAQGRKSMDSVMGLSDRRGKRHAFTHLFIEERNNILFHDMWRLNSFLGISQGDAATMVAERLKETPNWNQTGYPMRLPTSKWICEEFQKTIWNRSTVDKNIFAEGKWTKNQWENFLSKFPKHTYENLLPQIKKAMSSLGK